MASLHMAMMNGTASPNQNPNHNNNPHQERFQSNFKHALKQVKVPIVLEEGIPILHVSPQGQIQQKYITLSEDRFTLYMTTERQGWLQSTRKTWFRKFSITNSNTNSDAVRAIDIGSIQRIQRGTAATSATTNPSKRFSMPRTRQSAVASNNTNNGSQYGESVGDDTNVMIDPSQSFSIIFRGDWTLDFIMTSEPRHEILNALDHVLETYSQQKKKVSNEVLLLRYTWLDAVSDKDNSQTITSSEMVRLLDRINYKVTKKWSDEYEKFGKTIGLDRKSRHRGLTFEQACTLLHKLKRDSWVVKPINLYWNNLFGELMKNGKPRQNVSDKTFLEKFLWEKQGETTATIDDVRRLFARLHAMEVPHSPGDAHERDPSRIDKERFEAFLMGADNDAFDPKREQFNKQLMTRPISEYWVNSSHNTYLTGDQLTSHSSVDMYSNALYRGCRCLELDIWDGDIGRDGKYRPVVWHGRTMTSKILFGDIIRALKLFLNFHPDTFPLILSFENHCSIPHQEAMAKQLVKILGKALYIPTEASLAGILPSPSDLRGMVVIKGRRPQNLDRDDYNTDDDVSDDGATSTAPSSIYSVENSKAPTPAPKKVHHGVCPALARLTLFHGCKLTNWTHSIMNPTHHMHSFSENKVRSLCKRSDRKEWTIYNQSHMSRTYPAGSRVDSSNYFPLLPWSVGCQMVSLNVQTNDAALRLNDGRFRENGSCGYVLKPPELMEMHNPVGSGLRKPMDLSIKILMGSCLPKPKEQRAEKCIDPYVRVSVYDLKNGEKEVSSFYQTSVVYNNGFFPIWNDEKFSFTIENPLVAMLQLTVYDKEVPPSSDEFIASASIPISCLRGGLRSVRLFDLTNTRSGAYDFASLLIDVEKGSTKTKTTANKKSIQRPVPMNQRSMSVPEARNQAMNAPRQRNRVQPSSHRTTHSIHGKPSHRRVGSDSLAEF